MRHLPLVSSVHTPSSVRWKRRLGLLEQYTCVQVGALSTVYLRKTMTVTSGISLQYCWTSFLQPRSNFGRACIKYMY
jgi:hypothetical protein